MKGCAFAVADGGVTCCVISFSISGGEFLIMPIRILRGKARRLEVSVFLKVFKFSSLTLSVAQKLSNSILVFSFCSGK